MDKQNVRLKTQDFEVIGQGSMISEPCQIGEWWVMPADQYTGKIPADIQAKWDAFKALGIPVLGYMIADDMRDVVIRREKEAEEAREKERKELERQRLELQRVKNEAERQQQEERIRQRREAMEQAAKTSAKVVGAIAAGIGAAAIGVGVFTLRVIALAISFDPVLIACLPDGRWIEIASWWD